MPRYFRNAAILAKVETTYGVSAAPTGAANAMLISNLNITYQSENVARDLVVPFIGGFEQLVGRTFLEISFSVELPSSGAAGTAPPWGALLRACGYSETVTASKRVEYNPVTPASDSVTISYFMDGIRYGALGARGNAAFKMGLSQRPVIEFRFIGIDEGATAMATPALTQTAWKKPLVVNAVNSSSVALGCAYVADPVAISGGRRKASNWISVTSSTWCPCSAPMPTPSTW